MALLIVIAGLAAMWALTPQVVRQNDAIMRRLGSREQDIGFITAVVRTGIVMVGALAALMYFGAF